MRKKVKTKKPRVIFMKKCLICDSGEIWIVAVIADKGAFVT
jgi:hypothetical protein